MNKKIFSFISTIALVLSVSSYADSIAKVNPYLSAPTYGITHFDSSQSDTFPYAVRSGEFNVDLKKYPQVIGGPVNIITLASTSKDYMWGPSSQGVTYINVADGKFEEVSRFNFPGVKVVTSKMNDKVLRQNYTSVDQVTKATKDTYGFDFYRFYNAIYSVVDNENTIYVNYGTTSITIQALGLKDPKNPKSGIKVLRTLDVSKILDKGEAVAGLGMSYDGKLVIAGGHSITVIDREFKEKPQTVRFGSDESATNSIAIDEKNGIYLATDKYMRKVVWTGTKLSVDEKDGAWKSEYETSEEPPAIKVGKGTGSTPTLMGFGNDEDKLVVITDGAERMNIVAFWRDEIPAGFKQQSGTKSNRIAGQMQISAGLPKNTKWVQSEQSVVVKGYGAFVVNNIINEAPKDKLVGVISIGPVLDAPHGVERVKWDTKTKSWKSVWTRSDVSSVSTVPALSGPSNIVFVNGYEKTTGWEVTGMDWDTGKTVHRSIFGKDNFGNGAYSIIQFFPNGDMLFDSIAGPIRIDFSK